MLSLFVSQRNVVVGSGNDNAGIGIIEKSLTQATLRSDWGVQSPVWVLAIGY